MPKDAQSLVSWSPELRQYQIVGQNDGAAHALSEEADWQQWLGEHRSFSFRGRTGQINLLKEPRSRGGAGYWYAYQRRGKQMLKHYVGRDAQVSMERLEAIATQFATEHPITAGAEQVQFEPLLLPKIQLPRIQKSLLKRPQLLQLLEKSLDYRVTCIAGPAGYGKTTAVAQWLAERSSRAELPHALSITLDEGDNDPIRFWRYVIAAYQTFQPGAGKEALELLLANRLPPFKPLEVMLTTLLNEFLQQEQPCILILDDFHVISSQQVCETLSFFLDHLPASFHLFLLVRGESLLPLTHLRSRNEVLDIYPPYLGFSLEETRAFFEQELPFALSNRLLRQIYERVEGWPTGIRLFVGLMRTASSEQEVERMLTAFTGSFWGLQDYFFREVLSTLSEELQEFLLQTSVLPRLTAVLCDTVLQRSGSSKLLEALHNGDLFLIPLDATGEWGRYQTLFAQAMQQEARKRLGEEPLRHVAATASLWYEQHGYYVEAIETALNAAAFARAAQLLQHSIDIRQQSSTLTLPEWYDLRRWLARLPEELLGRKPDLALHYAMTLLFLLMEHPREQGYNQQIDQLLQRAEQQWRDADNTTKLAEVFAFRSLLARQAGRMLQAVTWARQALAWLPPENRMWRSIALTVVGFGETLDGTLKQARTYLLEALILNEQQGNLVYARASRGMLSWVSIEQGELRHAAEQFRQMQIEARMQEDYDDIARTQLGLAQLAYQWNNLTEARQAAQEALDIGGRLGMEEFQAQGTTRLALVELAQGQGAQARQRLLLWLSGKAQPTTPHGYHLYRQVQAALAHVSLADGDLVSVEHWFESIERREEPLPLLQLRREQMLKARLLLAQGTARTARELLAPLSAAAQETGHRTLQREIQAILVLAYSHEGRRAQGQQQLLEQLAATRSEHFLRLYLDLGEPMLDRVRELLPQITEKPLQLYARRIVHAAGVSDVPVQASEVVSLEPLSAQEQKVLRLLAAGNSNREIARELVVSVNTVRTQVQSIYRKLNVKNRVEASEAARKLR